MPGYGLAFGLASRATAGWFSQRLERRRDSGVRREHRSSVTMSRSSAGLCSLQSRCRTLMTQAPAACRTAIERANIDMAQDTITFAPALSGTISLSSALPDLSTNMIIVGPEASTVTVVSKFPPPSSGAVSGILTVSAGAKVTISGLTINGGSSPSRASAGSKTLARSRSRAQ